MHEMKKKREKNYLCICIPKILQILKRLSKAFHQAQTCYILKSELIISISNLDIYFCIFSSIYLMVSNWIDLT